MKPALSLSIPTPCTQNWNTFAPAANGGFCGSCAKVVVDFTSMSDAELVAYFKNNNAHTCGRFRADQLKAYTALPVAKINPGMPLLKAGFVALLLLLVNRQGTAQTINPKVKPDTEQRMGKVALSTTKAEMKDQLVNGVVKSSEDDAPLPGVNVALKGTETGVVTDGDGRFNFPQRLKQGDILVFSFIGLNTKEYIVPKISDANAVINMSLEMCGMVVMGEVATDGVYTEPSSGFRKLWSKVKSLF